MKTFGDEKLLIGYVNEHNHQSC